MFRRILIAAGLLLLVVIGAFAAVIAFNAPTAPPVLAAGNSIPGIAQWNFAELPKPQTLKARDGAPLNYRLYPGRPDRAVVLVHGSSGTDVSMLKLAQALQAAGATVYAISLRGHGGSGTDQRRRLLSWASSTTISPTSSKVSASTSPACIARSSAFPPAAASCCASPAASRPACSTTISRSRPTSARTRRPTSRTPAAGPAWRCRASSRCRCSTSVGLPWFQGLPAVHFATDAKASNSRTPVYSFRLAASLQLGRDWRGVLSRISAPTEIVVGANDELFNADQFKPMLQPINPRIGVTVVPNETHLGMIADPPATAAIAAAWRKLAGD